MKELDSGAESTSPVLQTGSAPQEQLDLGICSMLETAKTRIRNATIENIRDEIDKAAYDLFELDETNSNFVHRELLAAATEAGMGREQAQSILRNSYKSMVRGIPRVAPKQNTEIQMSQLSTLERARRLLQTMDPAIAGSQGHDRAFAAACSIVRCFDFDEETTFRLLFEEFNPTCDPPWKEKELRHKVRDAFKEVKERGVLLKKEDNDRDYRRWFSRPVPLVSKKPTILPKTPPNYPPQAEVLALWEASYSVTDNKTISSWLISRGFDVGKVAERDLCRALPTTGLPSWAGTKYGSWVASGHIVIFPLFDSHGALVSLRARSTKNTQYKSFPPNDYNVLSTVMADSLGRQLLSSKTTSPQQTGGTLIIVEGEPDFLSWSTKYSDADEQAPAVIGIFSGSWSPEIAAKIPDQYKVAVRVHTDSAGQKYAKVICESLANRCQVYRLKAEP